MLSTSTRPNPSWLLVSNMYEESANAPAGIGRVSLQPRGCAVLVDLGQHRLVLGTAAVDVQLDRRGGVRRRGHGSDGMRNALAPFEVRHDDAAPGRALALGVAGRRIDAVGHDMGVVLRTEQQVDVVALRMGQVDDRVEPVGPDDRVGAPATQPAVRCLAGAGHVAVVHHVGGGNVGERCSGEAVGHVGAVDDQVRRSRRSVAVEPPSPEWPHAVPAATERAVAAPDLGADDLVAALASGCWTRRASAIADGRGRCRRAAGSRRRRRRPPGAHPGRSGRTGRRPRCRRRPCPSSSHRFRIDTPSTSSPRSRRDARSASRSRLGGEGDDHDLASGRRGELARALQQRLGETAELARDRPRERVQGAVGQGEAGGW